MFHNKVESKGLGYHFDRIFLEHSGSEAVRQRSNWVIRNLEILLAAKNRQSFSILDLGCGPMVIEKTLLQSASVALPIQIIGVDFDEHALEYARSRLKHPRLTIEMIKENLVSPEGINEMGKLMANADVGICMGLIEYLEDSTVEAILTALHKASRKETSIFIGNFQPNHYSRPTMEWFLDWWLVYRTEADMLRLAHAAGYEHEKISTQLDETGSIILLEAKK